MGHPARLAAPPDARPAAGVRVGPPHDLAPRGAPALGVEAVREARERILRDFVVIFVVIIQRCMRLGGSRAAVPARLLLLLRGEGGDCGDVGGDGGEGAVVRCAGRAFDGHSAGGRGALAAVEVWTRLLLCAPSVINILDEEGEVDEDEVGGEVGLVES